MIYLLTFLGFGLFVFMVTACLYTSVMHFKKIRDEGRWDTLAPEVKLMGYCFLYTGLVFDFLLDLYISIPLLELPKEYTVTSRVKRLKHYPSGDFIKWNFAWLLVWRYKFASEFCRRYLTPFDPHHCD